MHVIILSALIHRKCFIQNSPCFYQLWLKSVLQVLKHWSMLSIYHIKSILFCFNEQFASLFTICFTWNWKLKQTSLFAVAFFKRNHHNGQNTCTIVNICRSMKILYHCYQTDTSCLNWIRHGKAMLRAMERVKRLIRRNYRQTELWAKVTCSYFIGYTDFERNADLFLACFKISCK